MKSESTQGDVAVTEAMKMILNAMANTPLQGEDRHIQASLELELPHALGCGSPQLMARKIANDIRRLQIMLRGTK
jgi:hypothetical protein